MAAAQSIVKVLQTAVKKIPWGKYAKEVLPIIIVEIVDILRKLMDRGGNANSLDKKELGVAALDQRISQLEQLGLGFGKLLPELEKQQKMMIEAIQTLSARVVILAAITATSFVVSLVAIILVIVKH